MLNFVKYNNNIMTTQIGMASFIRDASTNNKDLFTFQVFRILNKISVWKIQHKQYKRQNWDIIFSLMVLSQVEKLLIQTTYCESVVKDIHAVKFSQLLELNLQVNEISSIQPLGRLKAPIIQKLNLSNNRIVSIKPLTKMYMPYLSILMLQGNFITDWEMMGKVSFAKIVKSLVIQSWRQKKTQGETLIWMLKIGPIQIQSLFCESFQRIKQKSIKQMIRKKYPKIQMIESGEDFI